MRSVGISFGVDQYRQYHAGVVKSILGGDYQAAIENSVVLHWKEAHFFSTAYQMSGVSNPGIKLVTSAEIERYRLASEQWHRFLELPSKKANP